MSFKPRTFSEAKLTHRPMKRSQMSRGKFKPRRVSRKASVDGDSEKLIRDECDELVRKILRLRDKKCINTDCPERDQLHPGHYLSRKILAARWRLDAVFLQCDPHNELHMTNRNPYFFTLLSKLGSAKVEELERIGKENPRISYIELVSIRDGLRSELERLKRD